VKVEYDWRIGVITATPGERLGPDLEVVFKERNLEITEYVRRTR
jgi:hypothetical protein